MTPGGTEFARLELYFTQRQNVSFLAVGRCSVSLAGTISRVEVEEDESPFDKMQHDMIAGAMGFGGDDLKTQGVEQQAAAEEFKALLLNTLGQRHQVRNCVAASALR